MAKPRAAPTTAAAATAFASVPQPTQHPKCVFEDAARGLIYDLGTTAPSQSRQTLLRSCCCALPLSSKGARSACC
eukprot:6206570-Pleurochrysis_carterae.AAC.1